MINWFFIFIHIASVQHCLSPPFKLINYQNTSPCSFPSKEGHLHRNSRVPNYACKKGLPFTWALPPPSYPATHPPLYPQQSHYSLHSLCPWILWHNTSNQIKCLIVPRSRRSKYLKQLSFILSSLVPPLPSYGSIHFLFYPSLHYFPSILASSF